MADQGYTVIDCDAINREVCAHRIKNIFYQLLLPGSPAYASAIRKFGASIVLDNGEIDRARLRDIIFNDESKRLQLNKCLHTYIGLRVICNIFKYRILHWRQHVGELSPTLSYCTCVCSARYSAVVQYTIGTNQWAHCCGYSFSRVAS